MDPLRELYEQNILRKRGIRVGDVVSHGGKKHFVLQVHDGGDLSISKAHGDTPKRVKPQQLDREES
jgi:hypothetical protein